VLATRLAGGNAPPHRLEGNLVLAQGGDVTPAEGSYRKALDVARAQEARSLELRAPRMIL